MWLHNLGNGHSVREFQLKKLGLFFSSVFSLDRFAEVDDDKIDDWCRRYKTLFNLANGAAEQNKLECLTLTRYFLD
jgi:hypothetical protein